MRYLITGITGFAGSHLAEYLLAHRPDVQVFGFKRWSSRLDNLRHLPQDRLHLVDGNLSDPYGIKRVLAEVKPDGIFHLAAESYVAPSWAMPELYFHTNLLGTLHLFEALRELGMTGCRVQVAGSGEEYGLVQEHEVPLTEESALRPANPYAVSKVAQNFLAYEHWLSYGLPIVRTRTFNHEGPRRDKVFALPAFAWQIARIEAGLQEPVLKVGNLSARRNWTDVRDIVRAYVLALEKGEPGELYLVGSQAILSVEECLHLLIALSTRKDDIRVEVDPARVRPTEVPLLAGDFSKFTRRTGWAPEIPFEETLRATLEYWRSQVKSSQ